MFPLVRTNDSSNITSASVILLQPSHSLRACTNVQLREAELSKRWPVEKQDWLDEWCAVSGREYRPCNDLAPYSGQHRTEWAGEVPVHHVYCFRELLLTLIALLR